MQYLFARLDTKNKPHTLTKLLLSKIVYIYLFMKRTNKIKNNDEAK